jgi:signal transduction histidine kinase/CheY-like chemotaxis protein
MSYFKYIIITIIPAVLCPLLILAIDSSALSTNQAIWFAFVFGVVTLAIQAIIILGLRNKITRITNYVSGKETKVTSDFTIYKELRELDTSIHRMLEKAHHQEASLNIANRCMNQLEEENQSQQKRLSEIDRQQNLFLANMSHDLRTPLNGILGMAQLLQETALDDEQSELLDDLGNSIKLLLAIINDLLDISNLEEGDIELNIAPFDMHKSMRELARISKAHADRRDLVFSFQQDKNLPRYVNADSIRISQIMLNLISNAIKNTCKGGVSFSIRFNPIENNLGEFIYVIEDTGVGISPENQEAFFEKFTRGSDIDRTRGGVGLGLTICKLLVAKMNGTIDLTSILGEGSCFTITLPLEFSLEPPDDAPSEISIKWHEKPNILIVEDSDINRKIAERFVRKSGCIPHLATNGKEAVKICRERTFDLVLMDIQMPIMDGIEATKQIRKIEQKRENPKIPILALTASITKDECKRFLDSGIDDIIGKPVIYADLLDTLIKFLPEMGTVVNLIPGIPEESFKTDIFKDVPLPKSKEKTTVAASEKLADDDLSGLAVYDRSLAVENLGDPDLIDTLIHKFISELDNDLATIAKAIAEKDSETVNQRAHKIKGEASFLGTEQIHEAALQLEKSGKAGKTDELAGLAENLNQAVERLRQHLNDLNS